jgi:hypothetical protein
MEKLSEEMSPFLDFDFSELTSDAIGKNKLHKQFVYLKSKYSNLKNLRKNNFDSFLKKTKVKIFRMVHDCIKVCVKPNFKLKRLPQSFITNAKIDFNRTILKQKLSSFYYQYNIFQSSGLPEIGKKILRIDDYALAEKKEVLGEFLELTLQEVCEYYLTSERYVEDLKKLRHDEGEEMKVLFAFVAQHFIVYYSRNKTV